MKATATTRKNGTKRALAGILAAVALAAATVPAAAQAGMLTPCITASAAYLSPKTENRDAIDAYFKSLDYDEDAVLAANLETQDQTRDIIVRGANGNYEVVHQVRAKDTECFDTFSVMNSMADVIYPGSLLVADRYLLAGNPTPIEIARNPLKITIANANTNKGTGVSKTVNPTKASDVYDGIKELRDEFAEGTDFAAQIYSNIEKVESAEQIKAKMHLSQKVWGEMNLDVEAVHNHKKQACMVDISQVFYTVTADKCMGADLFADDVTVDDVAYEISNDKPAVMVSSVDYGRKIIACIQTDDTSFDLKTSLDASGLGGTIKGEFNGEYDKKLSSCSVKVFVLGGSSSAGGKFLTMSIDRLMQIAGETTGYDGYAMPICYTTRFAQSGRIAQSNYTGDKWSNESEEERSTKKVNFMTNHFDKNLTSATVKIYGRKIIGLNDFGRFIPSEEMLLDEITLDHATTTEGISALEGDVLLDTVRFVFSYEGANHKYLENFGVIRLNDIYQNTSAASRWLAETMRKAPIQSINDITSVRLSLGQQANNKKSGNPVERYAAVAISTDNHILNIGTIWEQGTPKIDVSGPKVSG